MHCVALDEDANVLRLTDVQKHWVVDMHFVVPGLKWEVDNRSSVVDMHNSEVGILDLVENTLVVGCCNFEESIQRSVEDIRSFVESAQSSVGGNIVVDNQDLLWLAQSEDGQHVPLAEE